MSQELTDIMTNKASKLTVGGLFSGIGGLELAFQNEGFKVAWANDIDKYTHQVYQRVVGSDHYIGNKPISLEYINKHFDKFDIQPVDVLTAGFPCQPFSNAGYREGFKDKKGRGNCFNWMMDFIDHFDFKHKPKVLLFENVKNIETHDNGNTKKIIQKELQKRGYFGRFIHFNTSLITDIPQNRERVFMVYIKDGDDLSFETISNSKLHLLYEMNENLTTRSFKEFLEKNVTNPNYYRHYDKKTSDWFKTLKFPDGEITDDSVFQVRRVYVRKNKKNECPTLVASMGAGGHNVPLVKDKVGIRYKRFKLTTRKLTPRECFRLQGYKDFSLKDISDTQLYKMAGNTVTLPLVQKIAKIIKNHLNE